MKTNKIAVLGGSFLQVDFVETALSLGMEVFVLDGNSQSYLSNLESIHFHHLNFSNQALVQHFCIQHNIELIYAPCNEIGNLISSRLASTFGYNYNPEEVVKITLDKSLQREKAILCENLYSPANMLFEGNLNEVEEKLKYPMVVKPSSSSAGRGITGVNFRKELEEAVKVAENFLGEDGKLLIEEFIGGDQISVETISANGVHHIAGITHEIVGPAPLFIERNHYMNKEVHERFLPIIEKGVKELLDKIGVKYGPCHIELKVEGNQVALIEIASRAGGLRDRLMKLAGYADYNKMILDAFLKNEVNLDDLHPPNKYGLVNILTKVEDLHSVTLGKRDQTLHSLYLYEKGPVYQPQNIIDAYGYAYFTNESSLFEYSLEHY